jgi:hypothetical protein
MAAGPAPVDLGVAAQFAILSGSAITSTGGGDVYGDVGLSPGGGTSIGVIQTQVHGIIYAVDALGPVGSVMDPDLLTAAKIDLTTAYNDAAGRTPVPSGPFLNPGGGNLGGLNVVPGLYKFSSNALISSDVTLTGGPDDVWIFQIASDLTVGSGVHVILAGGAAARNIFWQVGTSATLGTFCDFKGTIMADQSITMNTSCTVEGRALARIAMVTFNGMRINLPLAAPYSAGGRVWLDEDADAVQDAGEDGIANVVVELLDTNSVAVAETLTDLEGRYRFAWLDAGTHIVRVDTASMSAGLAANQTYDPDATLDHQTVVALSADTPAAAADFGYNWAPSGAVQGDAGAGAIGDRIWIDANGDGIQDPGEPGLAGVTVQLYHDSNSNGVYDALYTVGGYNPTTTNDAAGSYRFDELPPGAYVVIVNGGVTPAGYTQTGDPDDFGTAATAPDDRTTTAIILAPGDVFVNADFGYQPAASSDIAGSVYFDADANEAFDGVDYGLAGVSVALLDTNGMVFATTTTDASGTYGFAGLPAGDYTVWVNDTGDSLGGLAQTEDPDLPVDGRSTVAANGVGNVGGVDFGFGPTGQMAQTGLIGDTIFLDRDGNGLLEPGEGLQGVTVELYDSAGTTLLATTVSDANGHYWFGGLADDDYVVRVGATTLPNGGTGLTNTVDPDTASPGDGESAVTISIGNIDLGQDFGYAADVPNAISGTLWEDRNADGVLDGGETNRFEGITVMLSDTNGNIVASTVTAADGSFGFGGLPDGTYVVDVTDGGNLLNGTWHSTGPDPGADDNSQDAPYTVTINGGQTDTTADFGYYVEGATLGNRVWHDVDADGVQEVGEPGIEGVAVQLMILYGNGVTNVVTTVTDVDGFYSFGNLLLDENHNGGAGSPQYILSVVNPNNPLYPNHTIHNGPGVGDAVDADYPLGVLAVAWQGQTTVSASADPSLETEQAWFDFGFTIMPTLAVVSAVRARIEDGVAVISWEVSLELDTVGYHLERLVAGDWFRVNETLIWADPFAPPPLIYEQADPGAPLGTTQRYRIVELDNQRRLLAHGPYDLELDGGEISYATWAAGIAWGDADASPDADPDGDGLSSFQEYLAGTDPLRANSVLRVTSIAPVEGGIRLTWSSEEGRTYAVEMTTSLTQKFLSVATGIAADPPENVLLIPVDAGSIKGMYFRVLVIPPGT